MSVTKTIKLKRPTAGPVTPEPSEPAAASAETAPETEPAVPAAPAGLEASASTGPKVSSKSYLIFALLGLAATIFCIAIIGMQASEWMFYKADPSVWPVK